MKNLRIIYFSIIFIASGTFCLHAQETAVTAGGDASGTSGTVSYSVGQVAYSTSSGTNGSVSEGVQQAYLITVANQVTEASGIVLNAAAYPNPTTDFLILEVENYDLNNLSYQIYSITGKLLEKGDIIEAHTTISFVDYLSATYLLEIIRDSQIIKTFKIIKN